MYELLGGTPQRQQRIFLTIGAAAVAVVVIGVLVAVLSSRLPDSDDRLALTVESADVGPGVKAGTRVTLRGVPVGEVKSVEIPRPGQARVAIRLEQGGIRGLTDALAVRYQPGNYFGVTEMALLPRTGGAALRSGGVLRPSSSNDTISDLLTRSSVSVSGVMTPKLIDVTTKATKYTQAITPLLEVAFAVERQNAQSTTVPIGTTLRTVRSTVDGVPGVIEAAFEGWFVPQLRGGEKAGTLDFVVNSYDKVDATTTLLGTGFFTPLADMFGSHEADFKPGTVLLQVVMDATTKVMRTVSIPRQVVPVISGLNSAFVTVPEGTALRMNIVADRFPAAASVLPKGGR
ncbi:Mammalian cell entry related domain protein OS=Tsukamurella paurometabola (strain ATCC 8368 / DSM / CCUG 35730 / CIP 100753 / JCM 10117 / KCTC 9821 / NBRC 16120 / NCIMB 702349 / NCTC 13040) OX=521096 GN=Tpau_3791 PE=4 SV=1 [Tsukamurella paurometabola]|uniref:Mammalian cell entry related domain protein n=1 Tax=Tsukamurella paurometabola (strain ATCC 8368 / DSM 20162 / CCUG 35730 / CIP 100753 / JCM 10117 / KCTC 9821 / NBRC 16120 / NCIMB 702349 / NCTC 13040) TaxID=521096 RepID=D5UYR6_TSUPD|nr:MlaD family protein [Tsukamurella paurometabola]ADG80369.1 Mammalian cell entry related domain protein [Tsukamurella paurometabola DSM 20162]SUP39383.1 virulence factor Mce family protein [Tsukamurella paurometabola]